MTRTDEGPRTTEGRLPRLDGLRAFAVLLVAAGHWVPAVAELALPAAGFGVQVFFALSGFLITGLLLRARGRPLAGALRAFWVRRALRIGPLYLLVVTVGLLWGMPRFVDHAAWLLTWTFNVREFLAQHWLGSVSHLWTLSVEEQLYLVWPWLILLLPDRHLRPALVAAFLTGPVFRFAVYAARPDLQMVGLLTPACLDSFGIGGLLALHAHRRDPAADRLAWTALVVGVPLYLAFAAAEAAGAPRAIGRLSVTGSALVAGFVVWAAATERGGAVGAVLAHPVARYLGRISYGLYLFHNLAPIGTHRLLGPDAALLPTLAVNAALTVGLAAACWHGFEDRLTRWGRRAGQDLDPTP